MRADAEDFLRDAMANPVNAELLKRLEPLRLQQCYLTAGCLFQTVWNKISGRPSVSDIKDYDVFYFDADTSWAAEDAVIARVNAVALGLDAKVEVKNQARVHLWYQKRFGAAYPRLQSSKDGIDRYLVACTCVGIEVSTGKLYAPNGLNDLYKGVLRINPLHVQQALFRQKAQDYRSRWPWLTIID